MEIHYMLDRQDINETITCQLQTLDTEITSTLLEAEEQCNKSKYSGDPWSPDLARAGRALTCWKKNHRMASTGYLQMATARESHKFGNTT